MKILFTSLFCMFVYVLFASIVKAEADHWYKTFEAAIDSETRRLTQIMHELGEIGRILDESASRIDLSLPEKELMKQLTSEINTTRVPGYCAFNLGQEALSLLKLLSARVAWLDQKAEVTVTLQQKLVEVEAIVNEAEPLVRKTIIDFDPWGSLESKKIVEAIAKRAASR